MLVSGSSPACRQGLPYGGSLALEHGKLAKGGGLLAPFCRCNRMFFLLPAAGQLGGTLTQNCLLPPVADVAIGVVENFSASAVFLLLSVGWGTNSWWEGNQGQRELVTQGGPFAN